MKDLPKDDPKDEALERVRAARHGISKQVGHDPERLIARYTELQKQYADRLVKAEQKPKAGSSTTS